MLSLVVVLENLVLELGGQKTVGVGHWIKNGGMEHVS